MRTSLCTLEENKYVTSKNMWKIEALFSDKYILPILKKHNFIINDSYIEELFQSSEGRFYYVSWKSRMIFIQYREDLDYDLFARFTIWEALQKFGIDILEECVEKTCAHFAMDELLI